MIDLILAATQFATRMHHGQERDIPGGKEPYILHPLRVAAKLQYYCLPIGVVVAGILHDVIEDTPATYDDIRAMINGAVRFRPENYAEGIVQLVKEVTDVARPEDGNRAARAQINLEHLTGASPHGASIKLADMADNIPSIIENKPSFAPVWMAEKMAQFQVLTCGHPPLWEEVNQMLRNYTRAKELAHAVMYGEGKYNG